MQAYLTILFFLSVMLLPCFAVAELNIEIKKSIVSTAESIANIDKSSTSIPYSIIDVVSQSERFVDLSDLIENEVGVQIRKFGAVGSYSTAVLRGASSQQVVVYLDGIAINSAAIGAVDLSGIDIQDVERIEVYRGSTPIELGRASLGGAINIISKKSPKKNRTQLKTTQGSFSTQEYSVKHQQENADSRVLLSADYLSSDNNYQTVFDNNTEFNLSDDRLVTVNNDEVEKKSAFARWLYNVDEKSLLDTRIKLYKKIKSIPNKNNNEDISTFFSTRNIDFLSQYSEQALWYRNLDINLKFSLTSKSQIFDDSFEELGFVPQRLLYDNKSSRFQLLSKYKKNDSLWTLLTAIGQEDYQFANELRARDRSRNIRQDFEINLQQSSYWLEGSLIINASIRYWYINDRLDFAIDQFGNEVSQNDKSYKINQPQLGVRYKIDSQSSFLFNAGRYTRVPLFSELFGNQGLFRGNENLVPEIGLNIDAGIRYVWFKPYYWYHDAEVYIGAFYNKADDLIARIYNAQGVSVADNIASAKIVGVEWELALQPSKHWQFKFNGSLIDPRAYSEKPDANNKTIPGQYRQSYSLSSAYIKSGWKINLQQALNKDIYWDSPNGRKGDDYYLVDISLSKFYLAHKLTLQINNMNNASYANFDHVWDRPRRSFFLSYDYSF